MSVEELIEEAAKAIRKADKAGGSYSAARAAFAERGGEKP